MKTLKLLLSFCWLSTFAFATDQPSKKSEGKPNVLFIVVDDLRTQLGTYGNAQMISPNIDQLAEEGVQFNTAFANIPVCGASRASFMTGLRPSTSRFKNYYTHMDKDAPYAITLPKFLKDQGYYTLTVGGKFFHHGDDKVESWNEDIRLDGIESWRDYQLKANNELNKSPVDGGPAIECVDVPDHVYIDGRAADIAVEKLKQFKKSGAPFFLGLGIVKPHLPFTAPKKYWDMYNPEEIVVPEAGNLPTNAPKAAFHEWGELRAYHDIPKEGKLSDAQARKLIHGYYAAVSYADAQVGKVLEELKRLELDENTIVVLIGDHGYNLREHGLWAKHSLFDHSIHTPLFFKAPGLKNGKNKIDKVVEFVDIYPTIMELCGFDGPDYLQGKSMVNLVNEDEKEWKNYAFSKYHAGNTIVKGNLYYTQFRNNKEEVFAEMLFDHTTDPDEMNNIVETVDKKTLKEVKTLLEKVIAENEESSKTLLNRLN